MHRYGECCSAKLDGAPSTEHRRQLPRGPEAHVVGCTVGDEVFVATSAAIFHSAHLGRRSEVRVNGVVDVMSRLRAGYTVPIGWVAVGNPGQILPPSEHKRIWEVQKSLGCPLLFTDSSVRSRRCGTLFVDFRRPSALISPMNQAFSLSRLPCS